MQVLNLMDFVSMSSFLSIRLITARLPLPIKFQKAADQLSVRPPESWRARGDTHHEVGTFTRERILRLVFIVQGG